MRSAVSLNDDDQQLLRRLEADLAATDPDYVRRHHRLGRLLPGGPTTRAMLASLVLLLVDALVLSIASATDSPWITLVALGGFPLSLVPVFRSTRFRPSTQGPASR
jgi:hypothetical protein